MAASLDVLDGGCMAKPRQDENDDGTDMNGNSNGLIDGMARMTVEKEGLYYKMDHRNQGVAYIFNHQKFNNTKECKERCGTDVDGKKLENCLNTLGFDVHLFKDLKLAEIEFQIHQAVKMNHTNNNCFLLVVLSHGNQDLLYARDETYDPNEVFWNQFTGDKCPTLAGKPKLFFLQACQGAATDPGIKLTRLFKTETDGGHSYTIPIFADFLIMYATFKGHYAFRNTYSGSYFIRVLCEELEELAYRKDLYTILTIVNQRVAIEFLSYNNDVPTHHRKKQMPYFKSCLTRLVQFLDVTKQTASKPTFHSTGSYSRQF